MVPSRITPRVRELLGVRLRRRPSTSSSLGVSPPSYERKVVSMPTTTWRSSSTAVATQIS